MLAAGAALHDASGPSARPSALPIGSGRDTLLVTVDPRSPMPDRLGVYRMPGEPVAVTADVDLLHLDQLSIVEEAWADFTAALAAVTGGRTPLPVVGQLAAIAPGELTSLPGAQEFLILRRIRDAATSGTWRRLVVDLSGVGDPHAFLRAPTVVSAALHRLWPRHTRLAEAAEKPAMAQLSAAVEGIDRDCRDLAEIFTDPHTVAGHLVVDATERGLRAVPDHLAIADLTGLPLRSVFVSAGEHAAATADVAARVRALLGADRAVQVAEIASAGVLDRLARIRRLHVPIAAPSGRPRGSQALTVTRIRDEGVDSVYELAWDQALPDPDRLQLGRSGDDLLVTVSGFRHPVELPSVLRRCRVVSADWVDGRLVVRFVPDPAVWPARQGGTSTRRPGTSA